MLEIKAATNQACAAIVVFPTTSNRFVFHSLHSQYRSIRLLSNAGSQDNFSSGIVKGIQFPLPPTLTEQEDIAGALTDADALIDSLEQLLTKKRQIKQGAMQVLLTGQRRLPGFQAEWCTVFLGEVGTFLKGSGITREQAQSGAIPCVRYGEIYTTHTDYIRSFESGISPAVAATATLLKGKQRLRGRGCSHQRSRLVSNICANSRDRRTSRHRHHPCPTWTPRSQPSKPA